MGGDIGDSAKLKSLAYVYNDLLTLLMRTGLFGRSCGRAILVDGVGHGRRMALRTRLA